MYNQNSVVMIRVSGLIFLIGMMSVLLSVPHGKAMAVSGERNLIPLQPIIDRSAPGEVIQLASGRYSGPVTIDKDITIQGGPSVTVVNVEPTSTITIRSDGVKLREFTIEHDANEQTAAIQVEGKNSEITDLHIQTQGYGMIIRNASQATIQRNKITWVGSDSATSSQKGNGIDLYNAHDSYIEDNEITGMRDGIYLENSRKSTVQNNKLLHTRYGIHCMYIDGSSVMDNTGEGNMTGAMIMGVRNTVISGNSFRKQSTHVHSQGILLYDVHQSSVHNNIVEGNRVGMNIAESSGNEIRGNAVLRNYIGIQLVLAEANEFTRNQLVSNVIEASALDSSNNVMMKNYWDSFQGLDLNKDGISEMSYAINPFYEQLVSRNSAYQLFFQSPGMVFLSELYTEGRDQWTTDKSPRMSVDAEHMSVEGERATGSNVVWMLGLILLAMATYIIILYGGITKMNKSLNRRWATVMVLMFGVILLTACGSKYAALPINEDVDICAICKMQVKDDAYATQLTTKDGQNYKFDDIGCMNQWKTENGTDNIGMDYVRDYNDKEWIEYSKATYVYDASLRTPMAYGILNFKDKPSAEAFIAEQGVGTIMTAEDLASHDWKQNTENMDMMGEHGHGEEGMSDKGMSEETHHEGEMNEESGH